MLGDLSRYEPLSKYITCQESERVTDDGTLLSGSYLAFGPADPSAKKSLMGGADVAVVGFGNNTASSAYIRDFYLRDYLPCTVNADSGLVMGRAVLTYMHVLVLSEIRFLSALIKLN
jgi:hypothetical protein